MQTQIPHGFPSLFNYLDRHCLVRRNALPASLSMMPSINFFLSGSRLKYSDTSHRIQTSP